jgi:hypothetical protein
MRRFLVAGLLAACSHAPPKSEPAPAPQPVAAPAPKPAAEDDDQIKVSGTLGTLNDEEVSGPFQRRWDDITQCFADAKGKLWYLGGRIELKARVVKSGDLKSMYVVSSTLGNYDAERCILTIARDLHFSRPHGGSEAEFTYPIEFHGKSAVQEWDEARVAAKLHTPKVRGEIRECKQKSSNGLPPSVTLTLWVAPGGKITSAGMAADAPLDEGFAACVVGRARLWRVDDPLGKIAKCTVGVRD